MRTRMETPAESATCIPPVESQPGGGTQQTLQVLVTWFILAVIVLALARQNAAVPGLYYDEAVFGGMAKDFIADTHGGHMPGTHVLKVFGRPFPLFVQTYLGALNCWMLMPAVAIFGADVSVLRAATLGWSLVALLVFMLWVCRWLGWRTAAVAGTVLALDPAYFFLGVLDWGAAVPSLLCRFASFLMVLLWWRDHRLRFAFLAGLFAGLGLFNKIDFAVLLVGAGGAGLILFVRPLWVLLRARPVAIGAAFLGFALGAGPMIFAARRVLAIVAAEGTSYEAGELGEKVNTTLAMYDGSYFYRLMDVGGLFEKMHEGGSPVHSLFSTGLLLAIAVIVIFGLRKRSPHLLRRNALFLILAALFTTIGALLLPGAVRLHHTVLVYPFPQLLVALAVVMAWEELHGSSVARRAGRLAIAAGFLLLLCSQVRAIQRTQHLIRLTGGRGRWSESFDAFCAEVKNRADLTIVSLDWGFNEQLVYLTAKPTVVEPFWGLGRDALPTLPMATNIIYLVHPPEYSLSPVGTRYLAAAQAAGKDVEVKPWNDREGHAAFYTIRYVGP